MEALAIAALISALLGAVLFIYWLGRRRRKVLHRYTYTDEGAGS